ncbi:DEAD/DEAH box helicase [Levilactobacillus tujiorum]|uniref:DEAD/DEAH box helicase n=1 Tax=Levilactobacillus tujiorum TaxID=2912243 RepID=UPI00145656A0|nr:DEAD/DEAH box helicase [Levilactobacillus tujiorum]NLR31369.1 DEAD/DEAH box helicase [Levilactobacillus tujiorum]
MYQLHPYQTDLVNQARQALAKGKKAVLLQSPAGSGKSVMIAEIARLAVAKGGQVMFTVHRKELVNQIKQSFRENEVDLTRCTILTVGKIAHRLNILPKPTLIITDETHHSLAKTYQTIYDHYQGVPRLGFTATPWRLNGKGLHDVYDAMILGPSIDWLIENHYLAPYKYYSVKLVDDAKLKKSSTGDYTSKSMDEAVGRTIFGDVVKTYQEKTPGQQAIVYAHSVEFSKAIAQAFQAAGIEAAHADAKTPSAERERIMSGFKSGSLKVLCNVDLISEGFNVPDCSVVIMLRPTESLVLFIQQSMRSMRYRPDKVATIIDHVGNYLRFGLPDDEHQWTLADRKKRKKQGASDAPPIRTCEFCFAVIPAAAVICPVCGRKMEKSSSEMETDNTVELERIHGSLDMKTDYNALRYGRMKPAEAQNMEDLRGIAKSRGYKPGWIWFQAKSRGWTS